MSINFTVNEKQSLERKVFFGIVYIFAREGQVVPFSREFKLKHFIETGVSKVMCTNSALNLYSTL